MALAPVAHDEPDYTALVCIVPRPIRAPITDEQMYWVRALRSLRMTQAEVGEHLGIPQYAISRWLGKEVA